VREEIQNLARERAAARGRKADLPADSLRQGVPRRAVAFLKVRRCRVSWRRACGPKSRQEQGILPACSVAAASLCQGVLPRAVAFSKVRRCSFNLLCPRWLA